MYADVNSSANNYDSNKAALCFLLKQFVFMKKSFAIAAMLNK